MSIKPDWQKNLILSTIGLFVGIGYFKYKTLLTHENLNTSPSFSSQIDLNQNSKKWGQLARQPASMNSLSKTTSLFQVDINSLNKQDLRVDDTIELYGIVIPNQNISTATVSWVLFKNFEIVDGKLQQNFHNLKAGTPIEVFIKLRKQGAGTGVIHLSADATINGVRTSSGNSFSTDTSLGDKAIDQEMTARKLELLESEGLKKRILQ